MNKSRGFIWILVILIMCGMAVPVLSGAEEGQETIRLWTDNGSQRVRTNVGGSNTGGVQFTVPEGKVMKAFQIDLTPTAVMCVELFRWDTDYATTVAGTVLEKIENVSIADGAGAAFPFSKDYGAGTYLVRMRNTQYDYLPWCSNAAPEGVTCYFNENPKVSSDWTEPGDDNIFYKVSYIAAEAPVEAPTEAPTETTPPAETDVPITQTGDETLLTAGILLLGFGAVGAAVLKRRRSRGTQR